jgi:hypothetical protein
MPAIEEVLLYFFGDGTGVEVTRNAAQHSRESGLYHFPEGNGANLVCVPNAHFTVGSGWTHDDHFNTMGYAQAKADAVRHRDGLDGETQMQRDLQLVEGDCL